MQLRRLSIKECDTSLPHMIKFSIFHDYWENYLLLLDEKCGTFMMLHSTDFCVPSVAYVDLGIWYDVHLMAHANGNLILCILFEIEIDKHSFCCMQNCVYLYAICVFALWVNVTVLVILNFMELLHSFRKYLELFVAYNSALSASTVILIYHADIILIFENLSGLNYFVCNLNVQ